MRLLLNIPYPPGGLRKELLSSGCPGRYWCGSRVPGDGTVLVGLVPERDASWASRSSPGPWGRDGIGCRAVSCGVGIGMGGMGGLL